MRLEIDRRLDLRALDPKGISEVMGPAVARECTETQDGPTVRHGHLDPEMMNPETGAVLSDGSKGELVVRSKGEALRVLDHRKLVQQPLSKVRNAYGG